MAHKRKHLIALLLISGIFASQAKAEQEVGKINDRNALATLTQILEKGDSGIVTNDNFYIWQGDLSNHDKILKDCLVESSLYNQTNADIFVRSITQDEVGDLINVLNDVNLKRTIGAAAITQKR